jgi:hypothetical protein
LRKYYFGKTSLAPGGYCRQELEYLAFPLENTTKEAQATAALDSSLKSTPNPGQNDKSGEIRPSRYCPTLAEISGKLVRGVWSLWSAAILGVALLMVVVAYQFHPATDIKLGGGFDAPYLNLSENGFGMPVRTQDTEGETGAEATPPTTDQPKAPEPLRQDYRWTRERPILLLPGVGAFPTHLILVAAGSPLVPAGQRVEMLLNGATFSQFELKPGAPVTKEFDFGADRVSGGNLTVEMRVTDLGPVDEKLAVQYPGTFRLYDQRGGRNFYEGGSGFKLYSVHLEAQPGAGGFSLPPLGVALALVVSAWLIYLGLAYGGLAGKWAFGIATLLALVGGFGLAFGRLALTIYTGRLALLLVVTMLMLPLLDWVVPRLFRRWSLPLPAWAWQGLLAMFLVGMLGRGGGVLYPQMEVIDAPAHLKEINIVLHQPDGFWQEFSNKALSKVPAQWESDAVIPYSPFVYFYLAPVAALPIDPYISVNLFNTTLDALRVFIIFGLAAALGAGARVALVAAGLYLITPSTWLLNSWGNWPTTVSLWLGMLYLLLVLVNWRKLERPVVWAGVTFVLLLTMLGYTVTAVFMGLLLYGWAFGLIFLAGRKDKLARRNGWLLAASNSAAAILAVAIYFWQFIPDLAKTLTTFGNSLETKGSLGNFGDRSLGYYLSLYADHVTFRYGAAAVIVIAFAVFGWLLFSRRPRAGKPFDLDTTEVNEATLRSPAYLWLYASWLAVFVLFSLAQWKVDMVDKQVWFVLPLAVILAGAGLVWLWQRYKEPVLFWSSRIAVTALVAWTTYSALALWIERVFIKRR